MLLISEGESEMISFAHGDENQRPGKGNNSKTIQLYTPL